MSQKAMVLPEQVHEKCNLNIPYMYAVTQYLLLKSVHRYENIITQRENTDLRIRKRIEIESSIFIDIHNL